MIKTKKEEEFGVVLFVSCCLRHSFNVYLESPWNPTPGAGFGGVQHHTWLGKVSEKD